MWALKLNAQGQPGPAVARRLKQVKIELDSHSSRLEFGYCYLEMV
jgi:hypothetical protein